MYHILRTINILDQSISMAYQLEIRHLEYFLVLSETLHFKKAADKLSITQSALSQQIQRLEAILGQTLFIRTNRKVMLSHSGTLFVKESQSILNQVDRSLDSWKSQVAGGQGILKIGFVGSAMHTYLPHLINEFTQQYPDVQFSFKDLSNKDQLSALEKLDIDVGFLRSAYSITNMDSISVFKENFTLVLPKDHWIDADSFDHMGQLSEESFILFPNDQSQMYFDQILRVCADQGFRPKISHQAIHGPTIFRLVENGFGVSIVPKSLIDEHNYQVKYIELTEVPQKTELFATWNKHNQNPALGYLLEVMKGENKAV